MATKHVEKDGWSSVSYGWTCGHCGLERLWFSSKCCRRRGAPKPDGLPGNSAAAAQVPRRNRKRGARSMSKPSTPPEANLAKLLDGLKDSELFKGTDELAAMQAKAEKAREANKLAKRNAHIPDTAVCGLRPSNVKRPLRRKSRPSWSSWKRQAKRLLMRWRKPSRKLLNARRTSTASRRSTI